MRATDRTCASCGATVALLADRCPKCGGDPDVRYLELGSSIGRRGPEGPRPARRPPIERRRWVPIIAAIVVLWAFLALTADGPSRDADADQAAEDSTTTSDVDRQTSTTRRRPQPTTTTTTPVLPGAPVLGAPVGLAMILVSDSRVTYANLDTGEVRRLPIRSVAGTTPAGLLVLEDDLSIWPPPYDGTAAVPIHGPGIEQAWGNPFSTAVWLTTGFEGTGRRAVLVDLSGHELVSRELSGSSWPMGVVDAGLVLASPGGTYVLGANGDIDRVSTGDAVAAGGDRIIVTNCDEELRCGYEVLDDQGRVVDRIEQQAGEEYYGMAAAVAPDGRVAYQSPDGIVVVDGREVADTPSFPQQPAAMAWSPDGRWLALTIGNEAWFIDTTTDAAPLVVDLPLAIQPVWQLFFVPSA